MQATITKRLDPCTCGCKGSDPWHLKSYKRVLYDDREEMGQCFVPAIGGEQKHDRVATVAVPWSDERVKVVRLVVPSVTTQGKWVSLGWFFAR